MQSIMNGSCRDDVSESEPILRQPDALEGSEVRSSSDSPEIIFAGGDFTVVIPDLQNHESDADETCNLVSAEQPQCRICLDSEGEDLISPCYCRGTQKFVHRSCLDNWRSTKEGFAFSHCTECRAVFLLRANVPPDRWWLRLKFQFLVARDHALIFIIVQLIPKHLKLRFEGYFGGWLTISIVASLGLLVYKFYGEELREMFGYDEHPYGFYTMAVLAIVLVGLLYGFFIAIICGQRINERHYHVLSRQELTQEYIVEDREKMTNVPELDPSQVTELRILGLY